MPLLANFKRIVLVLRQAFINLKNVENLQMQNGIILTNQNRGAHFMSLQDYEFKVFSQFGEDGIIQFLAEQVDVKNKTVIEFGVEDYSESNTRFLVMKDNWSVLTIDGSKKMFERLRKSSMYWKHDIQALNSFITCENINALLEKSGFDSDLGILSVDIDGNDFWIYKEIKHFKPRIIIVEYNATFGPSATVSVPYSESFQRTAAHYSNLYFGASFAAWTSQLNSDGYVLVGATSAGNNAFFVRQDLMNDNLDRVAKAAAFQDSKFRESRDESGRLTHKRNRERLELISHLPVQDVITNVISRFDEILVVD